MIALQIVRLTADPDCDLADAVTLIELDPSLSAKILQAANSSMYGLRQPVTSVARAVGVLGLKAVRGLILGLSLPSLVGHGKPDPYMDQLWMRSAGGAVYARELAAREGRPPDDDFAAALLRDVGVLVMRKHFGAAWDGHVVRNERRIRRDPCDAELESFGIDHADVGAELLHRWKLPVELAESIRHHHHPEVVRGFNRVIAQRAELLWMADQLAHLDLLDGHQDQLDQVLTTAAERFDLPAAELIAFLDRCDPAIQTLTELLCLKGSRPNIGTAVAAGVGALVELRGHVGAGSVT
jgi:HD-like signal output (HDOD) protein